MAFESARCYESWLVTVPWISANILPGACPKKIRNETSQKVSGIIMPALQFPAGSEAQPLLQHLLEWPARSRLVPARETCGMGDRSRVAHCLREGFPVTFHEEEEAEYVDGQLVDVTI